MMTAKSNRLPLNDEPDANARAEHTGSNGNGRRLDKEGRYPDNHSPIHFLRWRGE